MSLGIQRHIDRQLALGQTKNPLDHLNAYEAATRDRGTADLTGLHRATAHRPGTGHDLLVLARRQGQKIMIGNDIIIELEGIRGNIAELAIHAPGNIPIFKTEILKGRNIQDMPFEPIPGIRSLRLEGKKDEEIQIGPDIKVVILEKRKTSIRIGIEAPRDITVHREEVRDAIETKQTVQRLKQQKRAAAAEAKNMKSWQSWSEQTTQPQN